MRTPAVDVTASDAAPLRGVRERQRCFSPSPVLPYMLPVEVRLRKLAYGEHGQTQVMADLQKIELPV